jgi:hypothetical protein
MHGGTGGIMNYLMFVCGGPDAPATEPDPTIEEWLVEVEGKRIEGSRLDPTDATTVRARGDEVLLTDGPFAETREVIAGYDLVVCGDLDDAIRVASRHPVATFGAIEVRPIPNESPITATPDAVREKFMLLVCADPATTIPASDAWEAELGERRLLSVHLGSTDDATTVRTRGHEVLLTDGPFAETREQVTGFTVVDCADRDEAIALAAAHPAVRHGAIEVRPFPEE